MIKKIFFIIGLMTLGLMISPSAVRADFCNPDPLNSLPYSPYREVYCNMEKAKNSDPVYEVVAKQFNISDPEIVKTVLQGETVDFKNKEFETVKKRFIKKSELGDGDYLQIYKLFKLAFDRENKLYQTQSTFEPRLKTLEIYANGTTSDSAFDVVADLNLIEVVLFGSRGTWTNDVYKFPSKSKKPSVPSASDLPPELGGSLSSNQTNLPLLPPVEGVGIVNTEGGTLPEEGANDCVPTPVENDSGSGVGGSSQAGKASGSELMCKDATAVTLKPFKAGGSDASGGIGPDNAESANQCPPGTVPRSSLEITIPEIPTLPVFPQSPKYPGPFVGGVLKAFPPADLAPCPAGFAEVKSNTLLDTGEALSTLTGDETPQCIPTELCGEIQNMGSPYIEALFCVTVKTVPVPSNPYPKVEGCIDCHIAGIVEILQKMRTQNVTPLENTRQAFTFSFRFGPVFSGPNLNIFIKDKIRMFYKKQPSAADTGQQKLDAIKKKMESKPPTPADASSEELLRTQANEKALVEAEKNLREVYSLLGVGILNDQSYGSTVNSMLLRIESSFATLRNSYIELQNLFKFITQCKC